MQKRLAGGVTDCEPQTGDGILLEALCAGLDGLSAGFVASFTSGRILHANRAALDMIASGWPVRTHAGHLRMSEPKREDLLLKGLRQVAEEASRGDPQEVCLAITLAPAAAEKRAAIATLRPLLVQADREKCVVALFITQTGGAERMSLDGIAECFGLTPAETRALVQFVKRSSVGEVAKALDISDNTAKTHLQNIFRKTGSSRQAQLIRLVSELQAPLRSAANGT